MEILEFEDGQLEEQAYVEIDGVKHNVTPARYIGKTPLSSFNLNKMQNNIKTEFNKKESLFHKYRLDISQDTDLGAEIELPFYYKVGADVLDVYYVGQRLIKCSTNDDLSTGHYSEVGEPDSISNKIKITSDWKASAGNYFEFVVRGEYNET